LIWDPRGVVDVERISNLSLPPTHLTPAFHRPPINTSPLTPRHDTLPPARHPVLPPNTLPQRHHPSPAVVCSPATQHLPHLPTPPISFLYRQHQLQLSVHLCHQTRQPTRRHSNSATIHSAARTTLINLPLDVDIAQTSYAVSAGLAAEPISAVETGKLPLGSGSSTATGLVIPIDYWMPDVEFDRRPCGTLLGPRGPRRSPNDTAMVCTIWDSRGATSVERFRYFFSLLFLIASPYTVCHLLATVTTRDYYAILVRLSSYIHKHLAGSVSVV